MNYIDLPATVYDQAHAQRTARRNQADDNEWYYEAKPLHADRKKWVVEIRDKKTGQPIGTL